MLDAILLAIPNVKASKAFGYPSYKIAGKVFAFVGGKGMSLKLTEARVAALLPTQSYYRIFEPAEGLKWKAWLTIEPDDPAIYHELESLFIEAIEGVVG
jgi:hypothetical protein